jgi:hypothetical protein
VLGLDPFNDVYKLQERIGVQLQQAQLQKRVKVWEVVDLWASTLEVFFNAQTVRCRPYSDVPIFKERRSMRSCDSWIPQSRRGKSHLMGKEKRAGRDPLYCWRDADKRGPTS